MNCKKLSMVSVIFIILVLLFSTNLSFAKTITGRLSSSLILNSPMSRGLEVFAQYVEEKTDGEIKIVIYPNSQLGSEEDSVQQVKSGSIELAVACVGPVTTFAKNFMLFDTPFLFDNRLEAWMVCDSPVGQKVLSSARDGGLVALAYMACGFRHVTNNKGPINTLEDFKGLKIRTMVAPMHIKNFRLLGANPTPVPWTELYLALQQGIVDGQENPVYNIYEHKIYDVQKYLSFTQHIFDSIILVSNPKWFDSLTEKQQEIIRVGALLGQNYGRFLDEIVVKEMTEKLKDLGMLINDVSKEERDRMREASQPGVKEAIKEKGVDPALMEEFFATIDQVSTQIDQIGKD